MRKRRSRRQDGPERVVWELAGQDSNSGSISIHVSEHRLMETHNGLTVGRHAQLCEFVIAEPAISRRHFRIVRTAKGTMIEDLNSLNGTYVDGWRLEPFQVVPLRDRMTIVAGDVRLSVTRQVQA